MVAVQGIMGASLMVQGPIMPLFLTEIGVEPGGEVEFWAGFLMSINFLIAALVSPIWGSVADRYGRKMMVIRSSMAICLFMGTMGFAHSLSELVALRALMGAFSGFSAAAIAMVASQVPEHRMGYALGWLNTAQLVGALGGPVIGGFVADVSGSYRTVFWCTSALAACAALLTLVAVPEVHANKSGHKRPSLLQSMRTLAATPGMLPLFAVLLMAQLGVRAVQPLVTLFVQQLTGPITGLATLAGFAVTIAGLADLLTSPFLSRRSDVIGYRRVLLISLLGAAVTTLPQAGAESYWQFLALRFGVGMFLGGILPTANALVARLVPPGHRGLALGITASATFLGSFLGPFMGGSVAATFGLRWMFVVTAILFFATLVWVYLTVPAELPQAASVTVNDEKAASPIAEAEGAVVAPAKKVVNG